MTLILYQGLATTLSSPKFLLFNLRASSVVVADGTIKPNKI